MSANDASISGPQCRAARALTDVSRAILSQRSGLPETLIRDFENRLAEPDAGSIAILRAALEYFGAVFLQDDRHGGQGVRLKFTSSEAARIAELENEGGLAAENDIAD